MQTFLTLIIILLSIILLYLLCLTPNTCRQEAMQPFTEVYIAHRGFFNNGNTPENSLAAFNLAVQKGYGIELDVQLTSDGKAVVFHDTFLTRMCSIDKKLTDCTYTELCNYRLLGTDEQIPLFDDVLTLIGDKTPIIIELKDKGNYKKLSDTVAAILNGHKGTYCVESFNPLVIHRFKKKYPHILRGLLSTDFIKDRLGSCFFDRFCLTNLLFNHFAKPDFIAYNFKYSGKLSYSICRALHPVTNVAWTIRTPEELTKALESFEVIIFDSFEP